MCCELLSNLYLCIGWHSQYSASIFHPLVVNCFQICIFVSDDTALRQTHTCNRWLWIAFKFVSLYRMTQPWVSENFDIDSCELLSNLYLCIGWHSPVDVEGDARGVVNCFQICIFVSDDTAVGAGAGACFLLWIAFKFVSLYRMTQLMLILYYLLLCCELLSNLYLCIGWHSCLSLPYKYITVVNCFQICIFVSDDTAEIEAAAQSFSLWIAFKFVSLYRMTQLKQIANYIMTRCELLSNLYLCIGWHSSGWETPPALTVVNCFQICIFVSDDTAYKLNIITTIALWIAFKFVSLYRMTQQKSRQRHNRFRCELLSNLYLCIGWHSHVYHSQPSFSVVNCFQICIFVSDDTAILVDDAVC